MNESWENNWKDYYKILQIDSSAEQEIISAAYRKLADKYHPDHNRGKEQWANEKFKEINVAYETLGNSEKRKHYHEEWLRRNISYDSSRFQNDGYYNDYKVKSPFYRKPAKTWHIQQLIKAIDMTTTKASVLAALSFLAYMIMLIVGSWGFFIHGGYFWVWNLWPSWVRIFIWGPIAVLIASKVILTYLLWKDDEKVKSVLVGLAGATLLYCMIRFPWFFLILLFLAVIIPLLAMLGVVNREIKYNPIVIIIIGPFED